MTTPDLPATERRNPRSTDLDSMSSLQVLRLMNSEDAVAVAAVGAALEPLADLVDRAVALVRAGGTVHYVGAGTSGRLGVLDAAELRPTFSLPEGVVTAHLAGGDRALVHAVEGGEDSAEDGAAVAAGLGPADLLVGLTASGTTPYVRGALAAARGRGATTGLLTNNPASPLAEFADVLVPLDTGPEVLTGSTRLKAGTAEKIALNGFSTALMVGLGRTWSNLMVSVVATNTKLRARTVRILTEATGLPADRARAALEAADGDLRVALVATLAECAPPAAREALDGGGGDVRAAVRRVLARGADA